MKSCLRKSLLDLTHLSLEKFTHAFKLKLLLGQQSWKFWLAKKRRLREGEAVQRQMNSPGRRFFVLRMFATLTKKTAIEESATGVVDMRQWTELTLRHLNAVNSAVRTSFVFWLTLKLNFKLLADITFL